MTKENEINPESQTRPIKNTVQEIEINPESQTRPIKNTVQEIEGHAQMSAFAGQLFNAALFGNTISDMVRMFELEGEDDRFRPRIIVYLILLGISLFCQSVLFGFTLWRYVYLRNRRDKDPENDCCGDNPPPLCNCCRGSGDFLFTICFILTTVITVLQVIAAFVGTVGPIPRT